MSEDVSATMRVGITVILVASLVATVLNLMVMSNQLITQGQASLQSGVESVAAQEFTKFDNKKLSGIEVMTALELFSSRDIAIIIQTKAMASLVGEDAALDYCALVTKDGKISSSSNMPDKYELKSSTSEPWNAIVTEQAPICYYVTFGEDTNCSVQRTQEGSRYKAYLHMDGGLVDTNFNIRNTQELGNPGFVLSSGRFTSTLIEDVNGEVIGILFKQIK